MMTKQRLQEIKAGWEPYRKSYPEVQELIAEVERLRAIMEPTCGWRPEYKTVSHVGPPDTTPCVQVPMADARDGGL